MATLKRPPTDITPKSFFEDWLPKEFTRLQGEGAPTPPDLTACVQLDGEPDGGAWTLTISGGQLAVTSGRADQPDIAVQQSVEDWRAITVGEAGEGPDLTPPEGASLEDWFVNPAMQQTLKATKGTLRFEVPGFRDRTFAVEITLQGAAEPKATISIDTATVAEIRSGALHPSQAFFAGKIMITGDSAFAMQVAMAAMAQQNT